VEQIKLFLSLDRGLTTWEEECLGKLIIVDNGAWKQILLRMERGFFRGIRENEEEHLRQGL
jgi:hypothetical protein